LSAATQVSRYHKDKTNPNFTEARDSERQWHQLNHMQVCTLLHTDNHASTHNSVFTGRTPFLPCQGFSYRGGWGVEPPNCFLNPPSSFYKICLGVDSNPPSSLTQAIRNVTVSLNSCILKMDIFINFFTRRPAC